MEEKMKRNQRGFTLIEIIAVLVILGILAAIAIPKYFDLQDEAKQKSVNGALAEGVGRINAHFGKQALQGITPSAINYTTAELGSDAGDFTLSYTPTGSGSARSITVGATGKSGTSVNGVSNSKVVQAPY